MGKLQKVYGTVKTHVANSFGVRFVWMQNQALQWSPPIKIFKRLKTNAPLLLGDVVLL